MVKHLNAGVKGVRIGFDEQGIKQHTDAELAEAVASGVRVLEQLGAEVIEIQWPDVDEFLPAWPILCSAEAVLAHEATYPSRREEDDYGPSRQRFTIPFDFNGTPTLSVPCGFNQAGLPLSLQFVGHPLGEPLLCQVGHAHEEATEWHTRKPNLEEKMVAKRNL